jgi:hypothetical protein
MIRTLFSILIIIISVSSCSSLPETKKELIEYINDEQNGLKKYKESEAGQFTLSYRPNELLPGLPESSQDYWYFILSLSNHGREYSQNFLATESGYTKAIEQLAFGMTETTYAITNSLDTVYCSASTFPRTYGSLDSDKILLVFEKEDLEQEKAFRMRVDAIAQEFRYSVKDITRIQNMKSINDAK